MIVATGFQRGAIEAADFFNIKLCSLEMVERSVKLLTLVSPGWYLSDAQRQTGGRSSAIALFLLPPSNSHQTNSF